MDDIGVVLMFLGVVGAIPAAILVYLVANDNGALRRLHATARVPIRAAQTGDVVKIVGKAAATTPLRGPISDRDVVWYSVAVTDRERRMEGTRLIERVTRLLHRNSSAPFTVEDGSGDVARVVVDGEEMFAPHVGRSVVQARGKAPPHLRAFLDAGGISLRDADRERDLVCTELFVAVGDEVVAIGPARREERDGSQRGALVVGERGSGAKRYFEICTQGERALGSSDRMLTRITWGLSLASATMIVVGGLLVWG